jgi:hypothetical protein
MSQATWHMSQATWHSHCLLQTTHPFHAQPKCHAYLGFQVSRIVLQHVRSFAHEAKQLLLVALSKLLQGLGPGGQKMRGLMEKICAARKAQEHAISA